MSFNKQLLLTVIGAMDNITIVACYLLIEGITVSETSEEGEVVLPA